MTTTEESRPSRTTPRSPCLQRFTPASATPTVHSYLNNATSIGSAVSGSANRQTVPTCSIVVVQLHPVR
ncbi:hypothetical protein ACWD26_41920 [Streptomyces sp. NPDC002787]